MLTSVTPNDREKVAKIEERIKKQLEVIEIDEEEHILPLMMEVNVGKRKSEMSLDKKDFFAKHMKYKAKKRRKLTAESNSFAASES